MARHKNTAWNLSNPIETWDQVQTAVLMDIRDELQQLNRTLGCANFQNIPHTLKEIAKQTKKRKYKRKVK